MKLHRKNIIISNLTSGRTKIFVDKTYIVGTPTVDVLQEAEYIYRKIYNENRFEEWLLTDNALIYLVQRKLCTLQEDEDIKTLNKSVDDKKVALYLSYFQNQEFGKKLRKELTILKSKQTKKQNIRNRLNDYTLEGFAERNKNHYIFYNVILDEYGYKLSTTFENVNITLLERIIEEYWNTYPTEIEYKEIARTEPWNSLWSINKLGNFEIVGNSQRNLVLYTQMYENAYRHPDCPNDKIIEDDDLFDGWMIHVRRKQDDERKNTAKEHIDAKHPNASEIYIPATTNEKAAEIDSFNDASGRILKKKRARLINARGSVDNKDIMTLDELG